MDRFSFFLIFVINVYKFFSRFTSRKCRFYPSCSSYAICAIKKHGSFVGVWMSLNRIFRCNVFFKGGIDEIV